MIRRPEALAVAGVVLAVSAAGNAQLGGPDVVIGAFGLVAAACFGVAITLASIDYARAETSHRLHLRRPDR
jgi:hypothetical protein